MWKLSLILLNCFLLVFFSTSSFIYAQDAQQDLLLLQQMNLSSAVRSALDKSDQSMRDLETYYQAMTDSLKDKLSLQGEEILTLEKHLTNTMLSFRASSAALENLKVQLEREKEKVRARNKILLWFGIIGAVIVSGKIAAFILYTRRVPTPRWLDIIL